MKFEDINENTIKISLSFQDLIDHDVKLSDFFGNQSVIEQLFYELVEELELEDRFDTTGFLTFQVQPHPKGIYLIVSEETDMTPEHFNDEDAASPEDFERLMDNFLGKLDQMSQRDLSEMPGYKKSKTEKKKKPEPDFIHYTVKFSDMNHLLAAASEVKVTDEESEVYRYDNEFYLIVLENQKAKGQTVVKNNWARLLEYGDDTETSREFLQEYGEWLIPSQALSLLARI